MGIFTLQTILARNTSLNFWFTQQNNVFLGCFKACVTLQLVPESSVLKWCSLAMDASIFLLNEHIQIF